MATSSLQLVVPGANNNQRFASTKTDRQSSVPQQTAVDGTQRPVSTKIDQRSSETTAGGMPYAVFRDNHTSHDKMKNKKVCTN